MNYLTSYSQKSHQNLWLDSTNKQSEDYFPKENNPAQSKFRVSMIDNAWSKWDELVSWFLIFSRHILRKAAIEAKAHGQLTYWQLNSAQRNYIFDRVSHSCNVSQHYTVYTLGGCHSHRLNSHSCDRGSKLWPSLFGGLTVDHANWPWPLKYLVAKQFCYLSCNLSPRACTSGNK